MKCQRCGNETQSFYCSFYNDQNICPLCKKEEQERDDYEQCRKAEFEAVQSGNLNFMFKPAWTVSRN